jgi:exopolyphosphatase/guanosine-5'-triphosphate,3'-diphosphate pyrophosphatase
LIRYGDLLGYTEVEVEAIANLARYHRKSPPKKKHPNYRNLGNKQLRKMIDQLSALLRLAVALDRRQIGAIQAVNCTYLPDLKQLQLSLQTTELGDNCSLELWSLNYKKESFETEFGIELVPMLEPKN